MKQQSKLITVIETPYFRKKSPKVLSENEVEELKFFLATNPEKGDVVPGLGGIRKVRWQAQQKGKLGGARVIYFFHNMTLPLFLLDVYAKSEKGDLSSEDKKMLKAMGDEMRMYGGKNG